MEKDEAVKLISKKTGYNACIEDGVVMVFLPKYQIISVRTIRECLKEAGYNGSIGVRGKRRKQV